jgi:hypothetical protein
MANIAGGWLQITSDNAALLQYIRLLSFAMAEKVGYPAMYDDDYQKLSKKKQSEFYNYPFKVEIDQINPRVVKVSSVEKGYSECIYSIMEKVLSLINGKRLTYKQSLIDSEITAETDGGESGRLIFKKNVGQDHFTIDEFVMRDISLCEALLGCGAFDLKVGYENRWIQEDYDSRVQIIKLSEKATKSHIDMKFLMGDDPDELNEDQSQVLATIRFDKKSRRYSVVEYLSYDQFFSVLGGIDLDSYSGVWDDDEMKAYFKVVIGSESEVDKIAMEWLTRNIVLGVDKLRDSMMVKKIWVP